MDAAPFRITLGSDGKRPRRFQRAVSGVTLDGAVLCAAQWLVWTNSAGRGKRDKFAWYRVDVSDGATVWSLASSGTLADAHLAWTAEDEARIDAEPDMQLLDLPQGALKRGKARAGRTTRAPKSRLALLVKSVLDQKR